MSDKLSFLLDGRQIANIGFLDPDIPVDSYYDNISGVIKSFTDRKAFLKSYKEAGLQGNIENAVKRLGEIKASCDAMNDQQKASLVTEQIKIIAAKYKTIRAILKKEGVSPRDHQGLIKLYKEGKLNSIIVYASKGCVGTWAYFFSGFWPKLSPFGWNDRISSLYNLGLMSTLHQHTWFGGSCLWVPPFAGYKSLGWYDNRISSMILYG